MSNNYNKNNRRKKRTRREKIGFYTAFSICLVAVCMAVYSTYNTLSTPAGIKDDQSNPTKSIQVNEYVTGVTEETTVTEISETVTLPTSVSETSTKPDTAEPSEDSTDEALRTMLSTDLSLTYPVKTGNVLRPFNRESTYFKTLNVWKPHTAVDFEGNLGDDVFAMCDGTVTKIADDKMYGKTVEISVNNVVCIYSGLAVIDVEKGDNVKCGNRLGTIGAVPFEASDDSHIHIAVRIDGKYADPLSFIGNNE